MQASTTPAFAADRIVCLVYRAGAAVSSYAVQSVPFFVRQRHTSSSFSRFAMWHGSLNKHPAIDRSHKRCFFDMRLTFRHPSVGKELSNLSLGSAVSLTYWLSDEQSAPPSLVYSLTRQYSSAVPLVRRDAARSEARRRHRYYRECQAR